MANPNRPSNIIPLRTRREVIGDYEVDADHILLSMYRRRINELFCLDCVRKKCKGRGTAYCHPPVKTSTIDTSWRR